MNATPFEKAKDLGTTLAAALALHQTLKDLETAREQAQSDDERAQIEVGAEILFQALVALQEGDEIEA